MTPERLDALAQVFPQLKVGVVGDFCLDRYLDIDPALNELSIETGLPVHNVVQVRAMAGGAGTVLNNLVALRVGIIPAIGFCGEDGEGFELRRDLQTKAGVYLDHFLTTRDRRTFTYCKPMLHRKGEPPLELNRLDSKNWTPTPEPVQQQIIASLEAILPGLDALIVLEQVDRIETGVITSLVLKALDRLQRPGLLILADSRRGLGNYPDFVYKMNSAELRRLVASGHDLPIAEIAQQASELARRKNKRVFVTLSEKGLLGAEPTGEVECIPALPLRGPIDVVGAGDCVTANLVAALAAGATMREAMMIATCAASVVLHKLGVTGTANIAEIRQLLPELK